MTVTDLSTTHEVDVDLSGRRDRKPKSKDDKEDGP